MRFLWIVVLLCSFCFLALAGGGYTVATPEPSMVVLLGAALAGIGVVSWRRNRKQ
jgi:hypothetical protein